MGLKLPPEFVNTPAHDVFNMGMPDAVYRTLAVLHGLAWQTKGERTPPTTVLELAVLRKMKERQMYAHLRLLKELGARIVAQPSPTNSPPAPATR